MGDNFFPLNKRFQSHYLNNRKEEDFSAFKNCDDEKTKVIVYPTSPFNKDDYKVETVLSCK